MTRRKTTKEFINQAEAIHNGKYAYDFVDYKNNYTKVNIFCKTCSEFFKQTPNKHLSRKQGCPICGGTSKLTLDEISRRGKILFNNKYNYDSVVYVNNKTPVKIFCNTCKDYFFTTITVHFSGSNCPTCAINNRARLKRLSEEQFLSKLKEKTDKFKTYDFSIFKYTGMHKKTNIICSCGYVYETTPNRLLYEHGCPICNTGGYSFSPIEYGKQFQTSKLYVIKIFNCKEIFYKIGITSQIMRQRFRKSFPYKYIILRLFNMSGCNARLTEIKMHKHFRNKSYRPLKDFDGQTECFKEIDLEHIDKICEPLTLRD